MISFICSFKESNRFNINIYNSNYSNLLVKLINLYFPANPGKNQSSILTTSISIAVQIHLSSMKKNPTKNVYQWNSFAAWPQLQEEQFISEIDSFSLAKRENASFYLSVWG